MRPIHILFPALFLAGCPGDPPVGETGTVPDSGDTDDSGETGETGAVEWPTTDAGEKLAGWGNLTDAVASLDAEAVAAAYAGDLQALVQEADAYTGKSHDATILALLEVGRPDDLVDVEFTVRNALLGYTKSLIGDAASYYPVSDDGKNAEIADLLYVAHDLWKHGLADVAATSDALWGEDIDAEIEAAFETGIAGVDALDTVAVGGAKQQIEKGLYRLMHRYVLAEATAAYTLSTAPERDSFVAARRAYAAYQLFEDRITDGNLANAKNSWGAVVIEDMLTGRLDAFDAERVWLEMDVAFAKRTYNYTKHAVDDAAEYLGTPSGAVKGIEGRTYYTLIAPGVATWLPGTDTDATLAVWDAYVDAILASDADAVGEASAALSAQVCDYMVALGAWESAEACASGDGPTYTSALAADAEPGASWEWTDDPEYLAWVWSDALTAMKSGISTASTDGALDHEALASAWSAWLTLRPLAESIDAELTATVDAAFADFSVAVQAGLSWKAGAAKQVIEKTFYTLAHRAIVAYATTARGSSSTDARDIAYVAYLLVQDRVYDENASKSKNSVGHWTIVEMLTGPTSAIDPDTILRELNIAFAKRTLAYTTHGLPSSEGGSDYLGTADGYVKAIEGRTYWNLIAPYAGADEDVALATWNHWAGSIRRNDLDEARWASGALQEAVCAYMQGDLGLENCSTADTSTEEGA